MCDLNTTYIDRCHLQTQDHSHRISDWFQEGFYTVHLQYMNCSGSSGPQLDKPNQIVTPHVYFNLFTKLYLCNEYVKCP